MGAVRSLAAASFLVAATITAPTFAQGAQATTCSQSYDACSDDCVQQRAIKAECFARCKRRLRVCTIRDTVLPARLNPFRSTEPAPVGRIE
jgi:hypothetical protein